MTAQVCVSVALVLLMAACVTLDDLHTYLDFLDAQPTVTRYSIWTNRVECSGYEPNSFFDTPLYASNGRLTEMGRMYAEQ